jgi:hypothetical protein
VEPPGIVALLIATLHRVPGVLLAEVAPGGSLAVVAHDAGVPGASLLAAAAHAGVRLTIVPEARVESRTVVSARPNRQLIVVAFALAAVPLIVSALAPRLQQRQFVFALILSSIWAFVIARAYLSRK